MFARIFSANLKPGAARGFARTIDEEVIPILRRFAGFRDEVAMVSTDGKQAIAISFWDRQADAEEYSREAYAEVFRTVEKHLESAPVLVTCDVTTSTAHAIATLQAGV